MTTTTVVEEIDVRHIKPHPSNPRLNAGDVSDGTPHGPGKAARELLPGVGVDEDWQTEEALVSHQIQEKALAALVGFKEVGLAPPMEPVPWQRR